VINQVDFHLTRAMDQVATVEKDAGMDNFSFLIVEKYQVTRFCLFQQWDYLTLGSLLRGITQQADVADLINELNETGTVNSKGSPASPQIGCVKIQTCIFE